MHWPKTFGNKNNTPGSLNWNILDASYFKISLERSTCKFIGLDTQYDLFNNLILNGISSIKATCWKIQHYEPPIMMRNITSCSSFPSTTLRINELKQPHHPLNAHQPFLVCQPEEKDMCIRRLASRLQQNNVSGPNHVISQVIRLESRLRVRARYSKGACRCMQGAQGARGCVLPAPTCSTPNFLRSSIEPNQLGLEF